MSFKAIKAYIENTYQNSSIINKIKNLNKINDHITIGEQPTVEQPTKKQHLTLYDLIQLDNLISDTVKKQISQRIRALGGKSFKEIQRIKSAYEEIKKVWLKNQITGSIIFDYMSYKVVELESLKKIMNYKMLFRQFYDIINEQHVLKTEKGNIWFAGSVFEYAVRYSDAEIVQYLFNNVSEGQKYQLLSNTAKGGDHADAIIKSYEKNKEQDLKDMELRASFFDCLGLAAFQIAVQYERYILVQYFLNNINKDQGYELIAQKCRQKKAKQQHEMNTIHVAAFSVIKNTKTLKILIRYLTKYFTETQIKDVINAVMIDEKKHKNTTTGALVIKLNQLTELNKTLTDDSSRIELFNEIKLIKESIEILEQAGGLTLTVKPPPPPPPNSEWSNVCIKF